jgi:hypothetical protein
MEKDIRMLVQERDYEGIRRLLSREPSLANAGVSLGPPCSTTAHPLHRICDAVFAKLITDDEAVEVAKILLEHGARIDGDSSTENSDTPLMAAASLHAENLGIFYIQNGARIDLSDKRDGATALHWAAYCGRDMLVDELIRTGVDVNQLDKTYKCTPLVWALQPLMKNEKNNIHHQRTCVKLLLEAGTDISTLDEKTKTFLDDLDTEELEPQDFEFEAKNKLPTINELVVYVPTEDFTISKTFYAALGFELTEGWGGTMDCRLGGAVFRLQNYYVKRNRRGRLLKRPLRRTGNDRRYKNLPRLGSMRSFVDLYSVSIIYGKHSIKRTTRSFSPRPGYRGNIGILSQTRLRGNRL